MFFNEPEWVTPQQSGAMLGMQFVVLFLFLVFLIALFLPVTQLQMASP